MKSISPLDNFKIRSLYLESKQEIHISAIEKDIHLTDILIEMSKLNFENFDLVFCGGTCLSKAYNILERMSEDIDFKVVLKNGIIDLSNNQLKKELSKMKAAILEVLVETGYLNDKLKPDTEKKFTLSRDGYKCTTIIIPYQNQFELCSVLRPDIKIELNFTTLQMDAKNKEIGYIYQNYIGDKREQVKIKCVSLEEAYCEKLITFPRRIALYNNNPSKEFDRALVRHIYDIYQIKKFDKNIDGDMILINSLITNIIRKEGNDFKGQHPQFVADPINELNNALDFAMKSEFIRSDYDNFVAEMVYANENNKPIFDHVMSIFKAALDSSLKFYQIDKDIDEVDAQNTAACINEECDLSPR